MGPEAENKAEGALSWYQQPKWWGKRHDHSPADVFVPYTYSGASPQLSGLSSHHQWPEVSVGQWATASLRLWSVQCLSTCEGADRQVPCSACQCLPLISTSTKLVGCSPSCPVPNTALGLQPEAGLSDGTYWYHFIYLHEYIPRFQVHMQGSNMYCYLLR